MIRNALSVSLLTSCAWAVACAAIGHLLGIRPVSLVGLAYGCAMFAMSGTALTYAAITNRDVPAPRGEPLTLRHQHRIVRLESTANWVLDGDTLWRLDLGLHAGELNRFARELHADNYDLSFRRWSGGGKMFTRAQYVALLHRMVKRGLARKGAGATSPYRTTEYGERVIATFLEALPHG